MLTLSIATISSSSAVVETIGEADIGTPTSRMAGTLQLDAVKIRLSGVVMSERWRKAPTKSRRTVSVGSDVSTTASESVRPGGSRKQPLLKPTPAKSLSKRVSASVKTLAPLYTGSRVAQLSARSHSIVGRWMESSRASITTGFGWYQSSAPKVVFERSMLKYSLEHAVDASFCSKPRRRRVPMMDVAFVEFDKPAATVIEDRGFVGTFTSNSYLCPSGRI
mmetsp:Transcript_30118/g.98019  ORF Transcript_30118/g.98019 Transcript_30118/m.98019 type:complete len:221 (-) Transcript_30118:68-730(-)